MDKIKEAIYRQFEQITVLFILVAVVILNYFISDKLALLNLFYLPALAAGFILGTRKALLVSIFSIAAVSFYTILNYPDFVPHHNFTTFIVNLISWGSFLVLASILVGHLHEENQKQITQLKNAYVGILEILSKYIESADQYTQGHSVRVSHYAQEIAVEMNLNEEEIENIKVAALLHDIGKVEISADLIKKASELSEDEKILLESHTRKGAQLISSVGDVLREAVPLVLAHHEYFDHEQYKGSPNSSVPLGARIIAVVGAYDAMTTDRPYRSGMPPWKALEELERSTGTQFDPGVVKHFKKCLYHIHGTHETLEGSG
jgi:putative nucleotidyltransferase with HDIG domain